jgi:DNA-directed RNA polymerase subunit alpha
MLEFQTPQITAEEVADNRGNFTIEPLDRGFGYTFGASLRRVLLSSLAGAAVTSVRIEGVAHEFSTISGVKEDVTDIILNLKEIVCRMHSEAAEIEAPLVVTGPGEITAKDIDLPSGVEILNPDAHIATLEKKSKLEMYLTIGHGRGYSPAEDNKTDDQPIGVIPIDSIFSPVKRVAYNVEAARVGQRTDYDKLTLEVETNGATDPGDAVAHAGRIIDEHMMLFVDQASTTMSDEGIFAAAVDESDDVLDTPIEELDLSVRSYNCLKRQGVNTIGQLTECSEQDLLNIRNFGAKSIEEVKDKLQQMSLGLKP